MLVAPEGPVVTPAVVADLAPELGGGCTLVRREAVREACRGRRVVGFTEPTRFQP
jgi:hypothetical protein